MNIIALWFALNVGFFPNGQLSVYETGIYTSLDKQFNTAITAEIRFFDNRIFVGGTADVFMWKNNYSFNFKPSSIYSTFYAGIRLWKGHFEFRYTHCCMHPILAWYKNHAYNPKHIWESFYDKFTITLQGEIPVWKSKKK